MRKNFMYCFFNDELRKLYHGIVRADSMEEALARLNAIKGRTIHPGTLMVKQLPDDVPVPSRLGSGSTRGDRA